MYLDYFELTEYPFQLTPNADFLYLSRGHARANAYMEYTIWNRDGFVVITGEIGSGKTTLVQHLLGGLDERVVVAKIHQTQLDELEFLQAILVEFGQDPFGASKVELLKMLNTYLLEQHAQQRQVVLIVDEAQNLSERVLEEVRLLTGLETQQEKILNLILIGQPELKDVLDSPTMEQLAQRIRLRFHLKGLTEEEVKEYIKHRLKCAGRTKQTLFPVNTIPFIYEYTGGIPRLINTLCDSALITAFVEQSKRISVNILKDAVDELQWKPYHERMSRQPRSDLPEEEATGAANTARRVAEGQQQHLGKLILTEKGKILGEYILDKECMTIGRKANNDITIDESVISGHHAEIITIHGNSFLEDLNSTNGVYVNSQRIKKSVLKDGDVIRITKYHLKYINEHHTMDIEEDDAEIYDEDAHNEVPNISLVKDSVAD